MCGQFFDANELKMKQQDKFSTKNHFYELFIVDNLVFRGPIFVSFFFFNKKSKFTEKVFSLCE